MADTMTLEQVRDELRYCAEGNYQVPALVLADAIDAAIKQRDQDAKDAARYRWLTQYPNLYTVNDLLRADQYTTLTRACDALMPDAAMAKESGR